MPELGAVSADDTAVCAMRPILRNAVISALLGNEN